MLTKTIAARTFRIPKPSIGLWFVRIFKLFLPPDGVGDSFSVYGRLNEKASKHADYLDYYIDSDSRFNRTVELLTHCAC